MSEIAGRHILITGGASGIGRLMAKRLAGLGGRISVWDIHRENLEKVIAELNAAGREPARGFPCDVARRENIYRVAAETTAAGGAVDMLINNAGVVTGQSILDLPDEKIEATFAINTLSLFWTAKAFLPQMIERGRGHIVTISSAAALIGVPKLSDYSASKWAAMGFDESLRAELRTLAPAIRTTIVCPYYIDTGMFHGVKSRFPWLLPILSEDYVAGRIVSAIQRDKRRLMLPALVYSVPLMRVLPVGVFDWLATFLGVNASMDEFRGRQ
ncbi:MAG TPA: SDR family oxidoreductase [Candidatus Margulisiibacteriota bacterium]|nr:SDR family oxidoreductase [Candidatus Margulisiibacteriota bacterium]